MRLGTARLPLRAARVSLPLVVAALSAMERREQPQVPWAAAEQQATSRPRQLPAVAVLPRIMQAAVARRERPRVTVAQAAPAARRVTVARAVRRATVAQAARQVTVARVERTQALAAARVTPGPPDADGDRSARHACLTAARF
jgi:hypothetical protein